MQGRPLARCFLVVLLHLMRFFGRISAISRVTSRWSHLLVQISELFSSPVVKFSRSNFGTFFRGLRLHFLGNSRSTSSSFGSPQKHDFGKVLGYGGPQKMFPWKRFSGIFVWQLSRLATKRLWLASFEGMTNKPPCLGHNKQRLLADQIGLKVRFEGSSRCGAN